MVVVVVVVVLMCVCVCLNKYTYSKRVHPCVKIMEYKIIKLDKNNLRWEYEDEKYKVCFS